MELVVLSLEDSTENPPKIVGELVEKLQYLRRNCCSQILSLFELYKFLDNIFFFEQLFYKSLWVTLIIVKRQIQIVCLFF